MHGRDPAGGGRSSEEQTFDFFWAYERPPLLGIELQQYPWMPHPTPGSKQTSKLKKRCEFLGGTISPNLGRFIVALASCGIFCAGQAFGQPNQTCKLQDLNGTYGFTLKGNNLARGVGYIVAGVLTSDGSGNISGSGKQTVGGQVSDAEFTGTYQINADCTGTTHLQFVGGVQSDLFFVLVQDGQEAMMVYVGPGVLESGNAKRVHTKGQP